MVLYLKSAVASIALFFFSCKPHQIKQDKSAVLCQLMDSLFKAKIFNGAIVIAEGDSIIFSKGYGYADFKDSVFFTPTTLSDGGSLAKTFTAEALWKLQKQGKISLKDPVQTYLPLYPYPNTSVLDLLSHHAGGLPDYDYFFSLIGDSVILTNELMLSLLHKYKPVLPDPNREGFNYENCGMDMAVLVLEKVTGKKYQQVLSELFFQPLHMDSTYVRPALLSQWKTVRTTGYIRRNDSLVLHDIADREGFYGGGNLHFTASDLCKWGMSFYSTHLHDDMAEQMRPAITADKTSGLTWLNSGNQSAGFHESRQKYENT